MFICASWGMLMPALRPPHTVQDGDLQTIQVRARRRNHLVQLRDMYMGEDLGKIRKTSNMDYNYRAYCTPEALGAAVAQIVIDIDYVKFKETAKTQYKDQDLYDTYNGFWLEATRLGMPNEGLRGKKYTGNFTIKVQ